MELKEHAELVRLARLDLKQRGGAGGRRDGMARVSRRDTGSGFYEGLPDPADRRSREIRRDDTAQSYVNRGGGDGDIYDRAARWDRHRATRVPKHRRARTPRAERDGPNGYVGYTGDWQTHFQGPNGNPTPVRRRRRF